VHDRAYAAIANLGTDDMVLDLLETFHRDSSPTVRIDGGGCGLIIATSDTRAADAGDSRADRYGRKRGPRRHDRGHAYHALREITNEPCRTGVPLRERYAAHDADTARFRKFDERQRPD
jgi:hypothetical protein